MNPRTFTDSAKRVWTVAVVYDSIVSVLGQTGIDLRQLVEDHDHVARELDDPGKLKQILGVLLADQLAVAKLTIGQVFAAITSDAQATDMVMAVYQATFDFFQSQGGVLNDALTKVQRAQETAKIAAAARLKTSIDNGQMDRFLSIATDPNQAAVWLMASQDPANTALAAAWKDVVEADLPEDKRLSAFVRLIVERDLELPVPATKQATTSESMSSPNAGDSPALSESIPAASPGDSST